MEKEQIDQLKDAFNELVAGEPFNGTVTHRTRPVFIAKWKELLKVRGIHGQEYLGDLLKALGRKQF